MVGIYLIQLVSTWVVSLLRYSTALISWRKCALEAIDRKTRTLFTIYGGLHPKSDVDRLYIPRKVGGRSLIAIEDCEELAVRGLEVYVHGSEERLLQAVRGDRVDGSGAARVWKKNKEKRLREWEEKALHGQYLKQIKEVRSEQSWVWLQSGDLKRETEILIVAAQNQSIRTCSLKKASFLSVAILSKIGIMGSILNPVIYMFVKLKYQTWIIL